VVHEMIHLIEPTHNARFVALMDGAMPQGASYGSSSIARRSLSAMATPSSG
jgi:predicted metal-dependent hydrolase